MDLCPESDDENDSIRSGLTGESSLPSSFESYRYAPGQTIFEQIVGETINESDEEDTDHNNSSIKSCIDGIISRLSATEEETKPIITGSLHAERSEAVALSDDEEIEEKMHVDDDVSSLSSEGSEIERKSSKKTDLIKERKKVEKLFGIICEEPVQARGDQPPQPEPLPTTTEQLYLDQCCSWFKRTTRRGNKHPLTVNDFSIEQLPKQKKKSCKRSKSSSGGGDE